MSNKKKEFHKKKTERRKANRVVIGIVATLAVLGIVLFSSLSSDQPGAPVTRWDGGNFNIGKQVSYQGQVVSMTDIELEKTGEGAVGFSLQTVEDSKLIYTNYFFNNGNSRVPVTAYISPAGRVVAAVSLCEPCQSESFHISGNELICDTCRTIWSLNDLQGISGGCAGYPPEELNYTVEDGLLKIFEADLQSWGPREAKGM